MKKKVKANLMYVVVFFVYFIMQSKFVHDFWFVTDELDVMMGGKAIANGYTLYDDFLSQHMPFSYYISAVFDFFGATSVSAQRLCFYGLFAFFWTLILYRYRKVVSQKALFLFPIIHMSLISVYDMGTNILSEHIAGIGAVIIFLEFLDFYETKELQWHNCVLLSIAVVFTFGTIFIGAFSVMVVGIAVVSTEISWWYADKKKLGEKCREWTGRYVPLIGWCALPWAILFVTYAIKGNLMNFIQEAYGINRGIYPKYMDGYGESIIGVLIDIPSRLFSWAVKIINTDNFGITIVIYAIVLAMVILFVAEQYRAGRKIIAVFTALYVSSMGTRGLFNYHSTYMVEMSALICAVYLVDWMQNKQEMKLAIICGFLLLVPYWSDMSGFTKEAVSEDNIIADVIDTIVEPKEAVWQLNFDNDIMMISDRASIANVAAVPWMWQGQGSRIIEKMKNEMPRVALYNENHEVWGYKLKEYAPELVGFMAQNYTQYENTQIYIRNDSYDKLVKEIKNTMYGTISNDVEIIGGAANDDEYEQNIEPSMEYIEGIELYCATYGRTNDSNVHVQLLKDDMVVAEQIVSASRLNDCSYNTIEFEDKILIESGSKYKIKVYFDSVKSDMSNSITLAEATELYDDSNCLYINGNNTEKNLAFCIIGE